jgi:hypothetical protein
MKEERGDIKKGEMREDERQRDIKDMEGRERERD